MELRHDIINKFITRLVECYGYVRDQIDSDVLVADNMRADVAVWRSVQAKQRQSRPDIYIVALTKEEHTDIKHSDFAEGFDRVQPSGVSFMVAMNLKSCRVFYVNHEVKPFRRIEIGDFPTAKDIATSAALQKFVANIKDTTKELALNKLSRCHNIIRNIDKLSPEAAFDEMSKILFIKLNFEKNSEGERVFSEKKFIADEKAYGKKGEYYQKLFADVKASYRDDHLFDAKEEFRIRRDTFVKIIAELQDINFGIIDDDIKGVVFENFLGKTFRGELGQFFTPRTIVRFMTSVIDIKEGELVCDPCCGSGGFLIQAFTYVQQQIDADLSHKLKDGLSVSKLQTEVDKTKEGARYYKLCREYFWGVDANARMARTAKMNMIMHGDGHVGVYCHDGLVNVGGVYDNRFDVILINPPFGARLDDTARIMPSDLPKSAEVSAFRGEFGEDYDLYVWKPLSKAANKKNRNGEVVGTPISSFYSLKVQNSEALFVERALNLLKPGGRAALVLPEGVLNNANMQSVRDLILSKAVLLNITSIPSDVFMASGANIKPSLLFVRKKYENEVVDDNYTLSVTKVLDAGIMSNGLPSQNEELPVAAIEIRRFIKTGNLGDAEFTRTIQVSELAGSWSVESFFEDALKYNPLYPVVKLKELLAPCSNYLLIEDAEAYKQVKVRLFNKGLELRNIKQGFEIGVKRQNLVLEGQFVVSKIDGCNGAFGFVPEELDGAVVTQDFMVFEVDVNAVMPEYLEMVMNNPVFLAKLKTKTSGSTGRKRLSVAKMLQVGIPLPSLSEQENLMSDIMYIRERQKIFAKKMSEETQHFYDLLFDN